MNKKYLTFGIIAFLILGVALFTKQSFTSENKTTADKLILQVPFSKQAPTDKWDRNEDCEETSVTMANAFLTGNTVNELPADQALEAINNLKNWENANLGFNKDTGAMATTRMAEGAFGLKVNQIKNFTEQNIKDALIENKPVLLPIDARKLNNPKYQNSGPQYHMIVIRGYDGSDLIINDPGVSDGNGQSYSFTALYNAAADWNQATQQMEPDNKIALVLSK